MVAFLEDMKSENETQYLDYFDSEVSYFEDEDPAEEDPIMTQEVKDRIAELGVQFTYIIKTVERNEDGDIALITVDLVTFDMGEVMDNFMTTLITKATEMVQNGATEEEINAIMAPSLLEAMADVKIDKHSTVDVRMNYNKETKTWWITGGETNVDFIDALYGGLISSLEYYNDLFSPQ